MTLLGAVARNPIAFPGFPDLCGFVTAEQHVKVICFEDWFIGWNCKSQALLTVDGVHSVLKTFGFLSRDVEPQIQWACVDA
jgi:hypothetical protein